jgi:hypothetical protein
MEEDSQMRRARRVHLGMGTAVATRLEVVPISPLVMLRLRLLESPRFTKGRLPRDLAVGPGFFMNSVEVDVPGGGEESTDWPAPPALRNKLSGQF